MVIDKTKPHAIFLDIDGTLTAMGVTKYLTSDIIPERNVRAIIAAQKKGHKVILNTGRGYAGLPKAAFEVLEVDGYITGLGTYIEVDGKELYNKCISKEILEKIFDYIVEKNLPCRFQGKKSLIYYDDNTSLEPLWVRAKNKEEFFRILGDDHVSKITVDRRFEGEYLEFVQSLLHTYTAGDSGEAAMYGCDKSTAMRVVLEALGIPVERSIAMGDSSNDIEILRAAGTSVAMANASDDVKAVCDIVTLSDVEGGVGMAIEDLLL